MSQFKFMLEQARKHGSRLKLSSFYSDIGLRRNGTFQSVFVNEKSRKVKSTENVPNTARCASNQDDEKVDPK